MKQYVEQLVEQSPDKVINRRQVIQGLALALIGLNCTSTSAMESKSSFGSEEKTNEQNFPASDAVIFLNAAELRRTIQNAPEENPGQPGLYSLKLSNISDYPVIGIRRTVPTSSEVHKSFTDVWFVLEGTATLVTGGTIVQGVEKSPGEIRGQSIVRGKSRRVRSGDFAVVPAGTPHWVSKVEGKELLYIVIKVPFKQ